MSVVSERLRVAVFARARGKCEYCLFPQEWSLGVFEVDHVTPRGKGGLTVLENLALACPPCNGHKWAHQQGMDAATGAAVELFNPRTHEWSDHFRWSATDPYQIEGLTPCGRATVDRLQMNDPRAIALRRALAELGISVQFTA